MAQRNWTGEQKQAIESRGGTLLVSAAAGSGKTAVLVERIVRLLTDPAHPCDADRLLVVTFTNAAAAQMRERIAGRLSELLAARPGDDRLRRQQLLFQNAHVSTIHAFCLELIRENFQKLGLPPDFRIADERESALLRRDLLDEILEERYKRALQRPDGGRDDPFLQLSALLSAGRGDGLLADTVQRLLNFLDALPDPEGWLDEKLRMYDPAVPLAQTRWGKAAVRYAQETLADGAASVRQAIETANSDEKLSTAYAPALGELLDGLARAQRAAAEGWDALKAALDGVSCGRFKPARGVDDALKDSVKAARDEVTKAVAALSGGLFAATEAQVKEDLTRMRPLTQALFELTRELKDRLFERRRENGALDFSDLEQLALKLLVEKTPAGAPVSTETARELSGQFDEILVDEYQDVNRAQDAIFRAVSRGGRNLFFVGDVKQSIYRFRQAMPELFLDKSAAFCPYDGVHFPAKILLSRNFRSRGGVTGAVNFVFRRLMSERFGEVDYGDDEALVPAAPFAPRGTADFSLELVDTSGRPDEETDALEARCIARRIRALVDGRATVGQAGRERPCRYGDFCILLRSPSGHAENYLRELSLYGIPAWAEMSGGYLGSYEVAVLLSLMRVLDNPLQDVALLSVLLSPVFAFAPDELMELRAGAKQAGRPVYFSLRDAAAARPDGRLAGFLKLLGQLRDDAAVLPADRLILKIFETTGFLNVFEAMPPGSKRRANLRMLLDYARAYEAQGYKGLAGFIRFIDRVRDSNRDFEPAPAASESADVVRVMSIHKSKGLEFPVVFVAACEHRFNETDSQMPAVFSPEYGFGCLLKDPRLDFRYSTLPRDVARLEMKRSGLSEETRVLYVAMTRAQERLFCVAASRDPAASAARAARLLRPGSGQIDPFRAAAQSRCYADWLLAAGLSHPDCGALRELAGVEDRVPVALNEPARWEFRCEPATGPEAAREQAAPCAAAPDPALLARLKQRLAYRYPWRALSKVESKVTVSGLNEESSSAPMRLARPAFLEAGRLTGAQAGTALHAFLQHAALTRLQTEADVRAEIERQVQRQLLLPEQGQAVDVGRVLEFLRAPVFERIRRAQKVYREFQFTVAVPPSELSRLPEGQPSSLSEQGRPPADSDGSDTVILQGMADLVFREPAGCCVLDYKTDRVTDPDVLRARYAGQLRLYGRAVRQILVAPVSGLYLYSFYLGKLLEIDPLESDE